MLTIQYLQRNSRDGKRTNLLASSAMNHAIDRTQLPIIIRVKDDYYRKEKIGMETELACIHKNQLNKLND